MGKVLEIIIQPSDFTITQVLLLSQTAQRIGYSLWSPEEILSLLLMLKTNRINNSLTIVLIPKL